MKVRRLTLIGIAAILAACASPPAGPGEPTPYINTDLGFRIDHPSNWEPIVDSDAIVPPQQDTLHAVAFVDADSGTAAIVYIQTLDRAETLADCAARQIDGILSQAPDAPLSDPEPIQLSGLDALLITTSFEANGQTLTTRLALAVKDSRGYALSLTAPAGSPRNAVLDEMLASFGVLP